MEIKFFQSCNNSNRPPTVAVVLIPSGLSLAVSDYTTRAHTTSSPSDIFTSHLSCRASQDRGRRATFNPEATPNPRPLTRLAAALPGPAAPTDGQILFLSTPPGGPKTPGRCGARGYTSGRKTARLDARARVITSFACKKKKKKKEESWRSLSAACKRP